MNEDRRHDERIDAILNSINALHTKVELVHSKIDGEILRELEKHASTLYDPNTGIVNITNVDHERIVVMSKLIWSIVGAVIILLIGAFGKSILKINSF